MEMAARACRRVPDRHPDGSDPGLVLLVGQRIALTAYGLDLLDESVPVGDRARPGRDQREGGQQVVSGLPGAKAMSTLPMQVLGSGPSRPGSPITFTGEAL